MNQEVSFQAQCSVDNISSAIFFSTGKKVIEERKAQSLIPMKNLRLFCLELCFSIKCSACKYLPATIPSLLATQLYAACVTRGTTSKTSLMYANSLQCIHWICIYSTFTASHLAFACFPAWLVFTFPYVIYDKLIDTMETFKELPIYAPLHILCLILLCREWSVGPNCTTP